MPFVDAMKSDGWDDHDAAEINEHILCMCILDASKDARKIASDPMLLAMYKLDAARLMKLVSEIEKMAPKVAA